MTVKLNRFIAGIKDTIKIDICCGEDLIQDVEVSSRNINILGLELNGYLEDFIDGQIQIVDSKGLKFLSSIEEKRRREYLGAIFNYRIPCIIFTDGKKPDDMFFNLAREHDVIVLSTGSSRWEIIHICENKLEELLAPRRDYRGTMMEVFGLGVLISGKSNVGKSECAIDLLKRGHRLIGDDLVEVTKRGNRVLVAKGKYPISHRMELRGIGIIDVVKLYGISSIKEIEKIELIIELEKWDFNKTYERLGIEEKRKEILGISIPYMTIPVAPGRNIAILVEVAVMNFRLRERNIIPAKELEEEVLKSYEKIEE